MAGATRDHDPEQECVRVAIVVSFGEPHVRSRATERARMSDHETKRIHSSGSAALAKGEAQSAFLATLDPIDHERLDVKRFSERTRPGMPADEPARSSGES